MFPVVSDCALGCYNVSCCFRLCSGMLQCFLLFQIMLRDDTMFPIFFQNVLREEVKEKMVWSIDRSSQSTKIRDLMKWADDILKDIFYQRKILSNPLLIFFTKNWFVLLTDQC